MLFDLRSPGRRRTVKTVYITLALLMGGGLVLFGIGGEVSGGIVDAITGSANRGEDPAERFQTAEEQALAATRARPEDAAAWAELARARFQLANSGDNIDQATGGFTESGRTKLQQATDAWERYLELDPDEPDDRLAAIISQAYLALGEPAEAARAQEIITEARPSASAFAQLAVYAYSAGQTRRGNLARDRALDLAEPDQRDVLEQQLEQARAQAGAAAAGGADAAAPAGG